MSYFVFCTFDLKNASRQDYDNAYADLAKLGLKKVVVSDDNRNVVIPTTAVAGTFTGASVSSVSKDIADRVQAGLRRVDFHPRYSAWLAGTGPGVGEQRSLRTGYLWAMADLSF